MHYKHHITGLLYIFMLLVAGCSYDNDIDLYQDTLCDTTNVTYTNNIANIISTNCLRCHNTEAPQGGILLNNYEHVQNAALIKAGNYGSLFGTINHAPGNKAMPPNSTGIDSCSKAKIEAWIIQQTPQ